MTREEIIRMAREAGVLSGYESELFQRFAALVAAAEREACAKVCDEVESRADDLWNRHAYPEDQGMSMGASQCAAAIRARGEK